MGCFKLEHIDNGSLETFNSFFSVVQGKSKPVGKKRIDYFTGGVVLPGRSANSESYRYGYNGAEKDDEIQGIGNSYNLGDRMLNPRLNRFFSVDPYASKFASQSPYVVAGNMPIWAKDNNGDSVLFYSQAGAYLGYSNDNQRYKGKNLLVVIADHAVDNFKNQYALKRNANYSTPEAKEANVAGLDGMGSTVIDVTAFVEFTKKYNGKTIKDGELVEPSNKYDGEKEFGVLMVVGENPITGKKNWVTPSLNSVKEGTNRFVAMSLLSTDEGWFHTHTSTSKGISFSGNDRDNMAAKAHASQSSLIFGLGVVEPNGEVFISISIYNGKGSDRSAGVTKGLNTVVSPKSFKNAK